MLDNTKRFGSFTSSENWKLLTKARDGKSPGKPFLTYVKHKRQERRMGRSLTSQVFAKSTAWGTAMEPRVFELLGTNYSYNSDETLVHPQYDFFRGTPDGRKYRPIKATVDIKAPYTLTSFADLVDPLYDGLTGMDAMNEIRKNHDSGEMYYQQIVSSSCITGDRFGELIIYCPYESELSEIKLECEGNPDLYFISMAGPEDLPYLPDGGYYKNLNIITFEIPQEDKDAMELAVLSGERMLQALDGNIAILPSPEAEAPVKALKTPKKVKQIEPVSLFDPNSIQLTKINP